MFFFPAGADVKQEEEGEEVGSPPPAGAAVNKEEGEREEEDAPPAALSKKARTNPPNLKTKVGDAKASIAPTAVGQVCLLRFHPTTQLPDRPTNQPTSGISLSHCQDSQDPGSCFW